MLGSVCSVGQDCTLSESLCRFELLSLAALAGQDLSRPYLAHHELESVSSIIIIIAIIKASKLRLRSQVV